MDARVIEVLQQAVSQDPNVLKSAEQTLKQWETQQGFYIALYVSFVLFETRLIRRRDKLFSECVFHVRTVSMERNVGLCEIKTILTRYRVKII